MDPMRVKRMVFREREDGGDALEVETEDGRWFTFLGVKTVDAFDARGCPCDVSFIRDSAPLEEV